MKIATRHLLLLELYMAMTMVVWGISGGIGGGALFLFLGHTGQNAEWGVTLCAIGALQFLIAGAEWSFGRGWSDQSLQWSVSARFWASFLSVAVWVYVCQVVIAEPAARQAWALTLQAPMSVIFAVISCWMNRQAACLLDPSVPTHRLQRKLMDERMHLWQ